MSGALRILLAILAVIVVLAAVAWFYLFGPNKTDAASLVPADTVFFATIPNGMSVTAGYETSNLKKLLDAPEAKPLLDLVSQRLGSRNLELLQKFAPNLSGQSFIAVTHTAGPAKFGVLLALEPKPGMGDFQAFVSDFHAEYPQIVKQGTSGSGQIGGLDYQWVQGPGASEKICVAQTHGWIVTAWSEAALADWWQRLQKKAAGPSLAENPDFKKIGGPRWKKLAGDRVCPVQEPDGYHGWFHRPKKSFVPGLSNQEVWPTGRAGLRNFL